MSRIINVSVLMIRVIYQINWSKYETQTLKKKNLIYNKLLVMLMGCHNNTIKYF